VEAEGWYQDPYGTHQERWISAGTPTALVRDDDVEGHDPPPAGVTPTSPFVPAVAHGPDPGADDLRRADDPDRGQEPDYAGEVLDHFVQIDHRSEREGGL
jgi:hypothetical protein